MQHLMPIADSNLTVRLSSPRVNESLAGMEVVTPAQHREGCQPVSLQ